MCFGFDWGRNVERIVLTVGLEDLEADTSERVILAMGKEKEENNSNIMVAYKEVIGTTYDNVRTVVC